MKAALSLDLDNKWSYMKTHGDPGWETYPSYLDAIVPRALEVVHDAGLTITFFVVGLDAAQEYNRAALASIAAAGHEIGNHSHYHEPWMHRRTPEQIDDELALAEQSIRNATGRLTRGFRGPGFVRSEEIYRSLARRGYAYDASTLATFIGPLARAYYFRSAKLDPEQRRARQDLFGGFTDGFASNRPHRLSTPDGDLLEIPVTTMPGLRIPIHVSYLLYLARISRQAALAYFAAALTLCQLSATVPSILLHPLDFLDGSDARELAFFPAMDVPAAFKVAFVRDTLELLRGGFEVGPVIDLVPEPKVLRRALSSE